MCTVISVVFIISCPLTNSFSEHPHRLAGIYLYVEEIGRKNERNNESILRKFLKDQMFVVTYPSHQRQVYLPHDVIKLRAQWDLPWLQAHKAIPCLWVITPKWKWYLSISVFIYKEIVELNWEVNVI